MVPLHLPLLHSQNSNSVLHHMPMTSGTILDQAHDSVTPNSELHKARKDIDGYNSYLLLV